MSQELQVGLIIAAVVAGFAVLGYTIRSYVEAMQKEMEAAEKKAHSLELELANQKTAMVQALRTVEVSFLEYKLHVSDEYVKRGDHTAILGEIFRKLEGLDIKFDARVGDLAKKIDGKQDRPNRAN
jgi:hypothetical protein